MSRLQKRYFQCALLAPCLFVASAFPACAYLDPGSGGMLIQGLAAFFFGVAGTLTVVFRRARSIWNDKDKKNADDDA